MDENAQFNYFRRNAQYTVDRENFAVESNCENLTHKIYITMNSEEACVHKSTLPGINVRSTTTASDPWLS